MGTAPAAIDDPALTKPEGVRAPLPRELEDGVRKDRWLSWRALLLGCLSILAICAAAPYNDYTMGNSPLIGNYLPISVVILVFLFVVGINGPLSRYLPRHAFSRGEIAVMLAMVLTACAVPTTGLMRYFLPTLVSPNYLGVSNPEFQQVFRSLGLPDWLFPVFSTTDRAKWGNDPVVTGYIGRWTAGGEFPYYAFVRPLLTWGIFFALLGTALVSLMRLVYRQWAANERLAFPLATIHLALTEPPAPGRWFNATLGQRLFWLGVGATFALHVWNGLSVYTDGRVPLIPLSCNLAANFGNPPWNFAETSLFRPTLFFTVIAVTYFLRLPTSFSLWAFFAIQQVVRMSLGTMTGEPNIRGQADFSGGAFIGFTLMTLYVGRQFFWNVALATLGFRKEKIVGEVMAGRVLVLSLVGMTVWLVCAGCGLMGAVTIVGTLALSFLGLSRIVAETGLVHAGMFMPVTRPIDLSAQMGLGRVSNETYFLTRQLHCIFYDQRECLPVYAVHGLKVSEGEVSQKQRPRMGMVILSMAIGLVLAYFASAYFHLRNEYTYAATIGPTSEVPIDPWGVRNNIAWQMLPQVTQYAQGNLSPAGPAPVALATGGALAVALYAARLWIPAWPLHPVGLVMLSSYSLQAFWGSFFIGWLLKALVVRFGGNELYNRTKPLAIGLIIGESLAAGAWVIVAVVLARFNLPFHPVDVLPR